MKKASLFLLFLAMGISAFAQNKDQYEKAMKENIAQLDTTQNVVTLTALANNFEGLASIKSDQWLPYYYEGLCRIRSAFLQKDKDKIDPIADEAEKSADKAKSLNPDKAEMLCLRSMIASARIQVNPMVRGAQYGPLSSQYLEEAKKIAPDNPRVYMLLGQAALYTPAPFGGGKDKAIPLFEKALEKFKIFQPKTDLSPNWGVEYTRRLLEQSKN